ncbi:hypothetical protein TEA_014543 [Camellia sinensis var. sinensis]|uniref:Bulb-type lectin domain-containing protein n=1 Tax=Camellia sinensis var. sinensis TaxID=542762 RepID=A0A4S4E9U5_CAMSN|nr:hypothetical protein TEA_014543 [Camellia sinensis var. sinensis]
MIYFVDEVGPAPSAQTIAFRDLPLRDVLFVSERMVIGVGFDCNPMIFAADERGLWSFVRFLGERKTSSSGAKYGSQFSEAFGKLYGQSKLGISNDIVEPSRPRGGIHENSINCIVPLKKEGDSTNTRFSTSGLAYTEFKLQLILICNTNVVSNLHICALAAKGRGSFGTGYGCGFYCDYTYTDCLFAVVILNLTVFENTFMSSKPQLVWSANRNRPVKLNATLQLTQDGDLILADSDGTSVWSTKTGGGNYSVSGLNLTEDGNLVLFDRNHAMVWQSFDDPTDSLLPGRNPYVKFENGNIDGYNVPPANTNTSQFMRLEPDGHLKVYEWGGEDWGVVVDLLTVWRDECQYPMACGEYGICSEGQCSCPGEATLKQSLSGK